MYIYSCLPTCILFMRSSRYLRQEIHISDDQAGKISMQSYFMVFVSLFWIFGTCVCRQID